MHTEDANSDGMEETEEEEFYVVSRGDFSGSPPVDVAGGEPWTAIPPPSPDSTVRPAATTNGTSNNTAIAAETTPANAKASSSTSARPPPLRKMSVTELVSKLDYETPKSPEKRLPALSPQEREQREILEGHFLQSRRFQEEEDAKNARFHARGGPAALLRRTRRRLSDYLDASGPAVRSDEEGERSESPPINQDGSRRMMPGGLFGFGEAPNSAEPRQPRTDPSSQSPPGDLTWPHERRAPNSHSPPRFTFGDRGEAMAGFWERHLETNRIARAQIDELRRQRVEEQIASGQPVVAAANMMTYSHDSSGNLISFAEGPQRRFRIVPGQRGADGSYRIEEELPPAAEEPSHPPSQPIPNNEDSTTPAHDSDSTPDTPQTPE